jgi:hypothetical protein
MQSRRVVPVAIAVTALALLIPGYASAAQSSTFYPAGDTISVSSSPVTVTNPLKQTDTCMFNGGSFVVPAANHKASGPLVAPFSTLPTITECAGPAKLIFTSQVVTSEEPWSISLQYLGVPTINIPFGGITCDGTTSGGTTLPGVVWSNGFTSPVSVSSAMGLGGTLERSGCGNLTIGLNVHSLTDVTHPSSLPLLGP